MMPRYFFDICDDAGRIPDEEGTDCADLDAAMYEASATACDLVKQYVDNRVKARLCTIDWKTIRAAQNQGKTIAADMMGWGPGDKRKYVTWVL